MTGSDDLFTPGEGTRPKMAEVDRLMHLCGGALEGLCSITIREDVRDRSGPRTPWPTRWTCGTRTPF